jgi:hypothetical protein
MGDVEHKVTEICRHLSEGNLDDAARERNSEPHQIAAAAIMGMLYDHHQQTSKSRS